MELIGPGELKEVVCFQYQRPMRYCGGWHLEKRTLLPGCVFLSGSKLELTEEKCQEDRGAGEKAKEKFSLTPCEMPYVKDMCQEGNLISISKGIIRDGKPFITSGPLKGREGLIRKIDRHKRTAKIEIPFDGNKRQVTVGLEIYEKL